MKKRKLTALATYILFGLFLLFAGCNGGGGGDGDEANTNNNPTPTVAFNQPTSWGDESIVQANLAVSLSASSNLNVTVDYEVTGGSADGGGTDYTLATGKLIFTPNENGKSIAIDIVDDAKPEENETIVVTLSNPTNATLADSTSHTYTIIDNDPKMTVAINQIVTECIGPGSTEVQAFVSVVDQDGEPIAGLTASDFYLFEDTVEVPGELITVKFIDNLAIPISVALTMDYSGSMVDAGAIVPMEDAVIEFVNLLESDDRAEIIKFATDVEVVQKFTDKISDLIDAINAAPDVGGWTSLYDALNQAIDDTAQEPERKAVLVITDGRDGGPGGSISTVDDVIANALLKDIPIFTIGLGDMIDVSTLEQIAQETGGLFYLAATPDDLDTIYQQLSDIFVLDQYVLTYNSSLNGDVELKVDVDYNGLQDSDSKQFTTSCF